jgi:hypothetical protein
MVLPRQTKSTEIRQELHTSTKKSKTTVSNSKQNSFHTKRKKLTKVIYEEKKLFNRFFYFLACGFKQSINKYKNFTS